MLKKKVIGTKTFQSHLGSKTGSHYKTRGSLEGMAHNVISYPETEQDSTEVNQSSFKFS